MFKVSAELREKMRKEKEEKQIRECYEIDMQETKDIYDNNEPDEVTRLIHEKLERQGHDPRFIRLTRSSKLMMINDHGLEDSDRRVYPNKIDILKDAKIPRWD